MTLTEPVPFWPSTAPRLPAAGAVATRESKLVQVLWKSTCTLPFTCTTMVPGVGLAS